MSHKVHEEIALSTRARRLLLQIRKEWQNWRGTSGQIYFEDRIDQYRDIWKAIAAELDAEFLELDSEFWEIRRSEKFIRIYQYQLELDNPVTLELAGRKPLVHQLLANHHIPVPDYATFALGFLKKAERFLQTYPGGIVIKPASGYGGKGVTTHITHQSEIRPAAILASLYGRTLMAEKQIAGECFRLLVFRGNVISAVRRSGLRIVGDGNSSIRQLIARLDPPVDDDPSLEREVSFTLAWQGLDRNAIPETASQILVSGVKNRSEDNAEVRTVYDTDVSEVVCPETLRVAESAAELLRSDFLGVDIITSDIELPLDDTSGVINELNTTPALHHHYDSSREAYPTAALTMVSELLKTAQD